MIGQPSAHGDDWSENQIAQHDKADPISHAQTRPKRVRAKWAEQPKQRANGHSREYLDCDLPCQFASIPCPFTVRERAPIAQTGALANKF